MECRGFHLCTTPLPRLPLPGLMRHKTTHLAATVPRMSAGNTATALRGQDKLLTNYQLLTNARYARMTNQTKGSARAYGCRDDMGWCRRPLFEMPFVRTGVKESVSIVKLERQVTERQRHPKAERFGVRLFEGPVTAQ